MGSIGRGMAELIASDLGKIDRIRLLERDRIDVLIGELGAASLAPDSLLHLSSSEGEWWPITDIHGVKQVLQALIRPSTRQPYYSGPIDESLGTEFVAAMKAFQVDRGGLPVNGTPGPETQHELQRVLAELKGKSTAVARGFKSPFDSTTAPLLGKMLRARTIVTGSVEKLGGDNLHVAVLIVPLSDASPNPRNVSGNDALAHFFDLEKKVVFGIIDEMGLQITEQERLAIDKNRPTQSLAAFIAYSTGLDLQSQGVPQAASAHDEFARAAAMDPGFHEAKQAAEATSAGAAPQPPPNDRPSTDLAGRLGSTAGAVGLGQQSGPEGTPSTTGNAPPAIDVIPEPPAPPHP
jgi:hypothetical protein